jgi:ABC-2 type transport system ATP-binding protein
LSNNGDRQQMLEVKGLEFGHPGGFALDGLDFSLDAGAFMVLLGPNGAGKTTLMSLLTRLYDAPQGRIAIAGHDLRAQPGQALARLGVVFQQPTLDLDLTVLQNLKYHAALHGLAPKLGETRAMAELERLDMAERAGEKVRQLNGGHRRRVEIARALLHRPPLLLLDEPTVGLDIPTRRAIVDHVHDLARADGVAVLWATHLVDEVAGDDRIMVLHRGAIAAVGARAEVLRAAGADDVAGAFARLTGAGKEAA